MATNPNDIRLGPEQQQLLAALADKTGKTWTEALREVVEPHLKNGSAHSSTPWLKAQEDVLAKVWDNDEDAEYDNL